MKKYIHYSLIIFIISIFLLSSVFGKDNLFLVGRIIVIDPGHQGIGVSQIWRIAIKPSKYKDDLFENRLSFFNKNLYFNVII